MRQNLNFLHKWLIEQAVRSTKRPLSCNRPASFQIRDQGFALPLAVGMGLIMILVGMTMIVRSQNDQVTASAQKQTSQSLATAESGVTDVQSFLNEHRGFATVPHPWTGYLSNLANPCTSGDYYNKVAAYNSWITIGGGTGRFRIIRYTPPATLPGEGELVIEGQALQNSNPQSTTSVKVKVRVQNNDNPAGNPPGAWAENFGLGNNEIDGDVIDAACPPGSIATSEEDQITGDIINEPSMVLPNPLPVPDVCSAGETYPDDCQAMSLPAITSSLTLPRTTDASNAENQYIYYVDVDDDGDSIDLGGTSQLIIKPGAKVTLYLKGNVNTDGSGVKIGHNCFDSVTSPDGLPDDNDGNGIVGDAGDAVPGCKPTNFQIFGGENTTSIVLSGSNTIDAFIFAPKAVHSGVNGAAQIRGSVWLKEWDRANGNHTVIVQNATWDQLPDGLKPPQLGSITLWQRQEATP